MSRFKRLDDALQKMMQERKHFSVFTNNEVAYVARIIECQIRSCYSLTTFIRREINSWHVIEVDIPEAIAHDFDREWAAMPQLENNLNLLSIRVRLAHPLQDDESRRRRKVPSSSPIHSLALIVVYIMVLQYIGFADILGFFRHIVSNALYQ